MSKYDQYHRIQQKERDDTALAQKWVSEQGLNPDSFASTDVSQLRAQQQAQIILTQHSDLITRSQRDTLECFVKKMSNKKSRSRLHPRAANVVMNISSKINRQLFNQYRQLIKATT
jgi:type IV pilus biogenesis protein CpaD/CtpE